MIRHTHTHIIAVTDRIIHRHTQIIAVTQTHKRATFTSIHTNALTNVFRKPQQLISRTNTRTRRRTRTRTRRQTLHITLWSINSIIDTIKTNRVTANSRWSSWLLAGVGGVAVSPGGAGVRARGRRVRAPTS